MLTAYDYPSARLADDAGTDMILIGDSLAMVCLGYESTLQLPFEEFKYHVKAVARGSEHAFLVADLPFGSFEISAQQGLKSSIELVKECGAQAVKLEGLHESLTKQLTAIGVPVLGHLGLQPQKLNAMGGYKVQGKTTESALEIYDNCRRLQDAGVFGIVLEAVPEKIAELITKKLEVPTIGIGAGPQCSGQVLVQADALGMLNAEKDAKFVRRFANVYESSLAGLSEYNATVRDRSFPQVPTHTYKVSQQVVDEFADKINNL